MKIKIGFGFDVHQLKDNHPFFVGGVNLEHHKGAFGHSDADVLLHAICDAMLGAVNAGEKGVSSVLLLQETVKLINEKGWEIGNIDAMLCLEAPKINPYIPKMQEIIATAIDISVEDISIKATTGEQMGFVGREEGVVAYAVCLINKK